MILVSQVVNEIADSRNVLLFLEVVIDKSTSKQLPEGDDNKILSTYKILLKIYFVYEFLKKFYHLSLFSDYQDSGLTEIKII